MNGTLLPPGAAQPKQNSLTKWFLIIIFGLIVVFGLFIAAYLVSYSDEMGITVIRMEGTMVTGQASDAETIGSEVVGGELRDAADDPMVEAIVLRVKVPGVHRLPHRRSSAISRTQRQKSLSWSRWAIWGPLLRIM